MNTSKILAILFLCILTAPLGGFVWVPILFLWGKYVKFCIKIDLIVIYLLIRLPIWACIQLPLHLMKVGTGKIEAFFVAGYNKILRSRKTAVFLFLVTGAFFMFFFAPGSSLTTPNPLSIGWWIQSIESLAYIAVGSVSTTMILLSVKEAISGNIAQGEVPAQWSRGELRSAPGDFTGSAIEGARNAKETAQTVRETTEKAKGAFNKIHPERTAAESEELLSFDMSAMIGDLAESFGFVEEGAVAGEAAGASGAMAGVTAGTAGLGLAAIIIVLLIAFIVFVAQLVLVLGFFIGYINFIAPMILGPLGAALGLGSQYGNWISGELGDRFLAGVSVNFEDEIATVMEARQRVFCLLEGPACLRQWQLNNTRTPDSQNVGEKYKLKLERFEVGSGEQVDVAYKDGSYRLPISFGLSNARNGMYGINALNVSYRLKVIDFSRDNVLQAGSDPYCETGWRPVQGYDIREPEDPGYIEVGSSGSDSSSQDTAESGRRAAVDQLSGDSSGSSGGSGERLYYEGNDLYPGTSASTGFMRLDKITLENCGLLQPGAGETKTVLLEVKYDYYSEATLYFEAMARKVMQQNSEVQMKWKASETADTPVKSILNVNSPVLYEQDKIGTSEEAAIPFDMRTSLSAEGSDVEYRINHLEVIKSSEVEIADNARNCELRPESEGSSILVPSGNAESIVGEGSDARWYSSANPPPFFGCSMKLSDPGQINPNGQTLSMDVRANYTVKLNQKLTRFRILNTRCNAINCPLLVTQQFIQGRSDSDNWKIKCSGPDASDGCAVVQGDPDDWSSIDFMTGHDLLDSKLESGEYAFDPFEAGVVYDENGHMSELKEKIDYDEDVGAAIGLKRRELTRVTNRGLAQEGFAVLSVPQSDGAIRGGTNPSRDVQVVTLETKICSNKNYESRLQGYKQESGQKNPFSAYGTQDEEPYLISFYPLDKDCSQDSQSN